MKTTKIRILEKIKGISNTERRQYNYITTIYGSDMSIGELGKNNISRSSNIALRCFGSRKMEIGECFLVLDEELMS